MPRKKISPEPEIEYPLAPQEKQKRKLTYTPVLVILLIVASFFLGMLFTKVQYLEKNNVLGAQNPQQQPAGAQPSTAPQKYTVGNGHFPVKGNDKAKVTIVEFADFRCPFCEKFYTDVKPQIIKEYVDTGKVKLYYRQYPFLGPASIVAADAAECANEQGKFWDYYDYLFKNQPDESDTSMYNTDTLTQAATTLSLNGDQFRQCLDSKKYDAQAQADLADGQKVGVQGTPTFYINGTQLVGAQPYSAFKTVIDQALAEAK
jgi:protein-disulfide isomerase